MGPDVKSSPKKKAKTDVQTAGAAADNVASASTVSSNGVDGELHANGADGGQETSHMRDLQRSVRNVMKKLAAMQKVDSIIAEHPNTSLDDLVASRKINADQKAQALKKPALRAQLSQLEDQIAVYKKLEQDFQAQADKEKERLEASYKLELGALRTKLEGQAKAVQADATRKHLLTLSTFLRAAAARRSVEDETTEESQAFEGLLMDLYGGNVTAVDAAEKLINGSHDTVKNTEGNALTVTYARVKEMSEEMAPADSDNFQVQHEDPTAGEPPAYAEAAGAVESDPTIAHAGLTELNTQQPHTGQESHPLSAQATIDAGAANANAATHWDVAPSSVADPMGDSWVSVPRPADETEHQPQASAPGDTNSWENKNDTNDSSNNTAGDWGDAGTAEPKVAWADEASEIPVNDGFREVHHHHRGNRARGGVGSEGRGGGRGRMRGGFRGEPRGGRGRGGRGPRGRGDGA